MWIVNQYNGKTFKVKDKLKSVSTDISYAIKLFEPFLNTVNQEQVKPLLVSHLNWFTSVTATLGSDWKNEITSKCGGKWSLAAFSFRGMCGVQ